MVITIFKKIFEMIVNSGVSSLFCFCWSNIRVIASVIFFVACCLINRTLLSESSWFFKTYSSFFTICDCDKTANSSFKSDFSLC